MHQRPLSIAIERLIVASHRGQTDEDEVKAAVAPVKTALEAIESLTVGHPYCSVTN
jgi:glutathione S-transferase